MSETYDNKRVMPPHGLQDIDFSFTRWWDEKLNLHVTTKDGSKKKVPVHLVSPERWFMAREDGIRDENGSIVLPIVAISRTRIGGSNEEPYQRIIADTKRPITYSRKVHKKSSLVKELIKDRKWTIDPSLPIYEVFTTRTPDHMVISYEVSIWTQYIEEMNEIIEKIGQEYDYLSVKSFSFKINSSGYFVAFQDNELTDDGNLDDFSGAERLVRRIMTFNVPGWILPEVDNRKSNFRRYLSRTRLVFTNEVVFTGDLDDII